jgi:hypothetical protein
VEEVGPSTSCRPVRGFDHLSTHNTSVAQTPRLMPASSVIVSGYKGVRAMINITIMLRSAKEIARGVRIGWSVAAYALGGA